MGHEPATEPSQGDGPGFATLSLDYPMSLGVFEKYEDAQKAVDTLSDKEFPVQNCLIVGTDLKQIERVTARLTWGRVAPRRAAVGRVAGRLRRPHPLALRPTVEHLRAAALRRALGCGLRRWCGAAAGYAFTRGQRDFSSVTQVIATRYEVFCEHKFAQQGRQILAEAGLAVGPHASGGTGGTGVAHPAAPAAPSSVPPPVAGGDEPGPPPRAH